MKKRSRAGTKSWTCSGERETASEAFMEVVAEFAETLLGLPAKADALSFVQVAVRAMLVYGALIAFVRLGKKRFLAQDGF